MQNKLSPCQTTGFDDPAREQYIKFCMQDVLRYRTRASQSVRQRFPADAGGRLFEYLSDAELLARRKKIGKDFRVLIVAPATTVEGGHIKVVIEQRVISLSRGHLALSISDWGSVFLRFEPNKHDFVIDRAVLGGI
jgi:hypothetical protein